MGAKNESAARGQVLDSPPSLVPDLLRCAKGQHALCIATAAPNRQVLSPFLLELLRVVHPPAADLPGIEDVHTRLDEQRERVIDSTIVVWKNM